MHSVSYWYVWFGLVWFGLVWFALVWFGLVWFGLAWIGLAWIGLVLLCTPNPQYILLIGFYCLGGSHLASCPDGTILLTKGGTSLDDCAACDAGR
jgi:hypothetical protein